MSFLSNFEWSQNIFYLLAGAMVFFGFFTVVTKHILRSAIYLMSVLFFSAGIYLLLGADFLAGAQVLIYIGGIIVLLVFAVMLTRSADLAEDHPPLTRKLFGAAGAITFFVVSAYLIEQSPLIIEKSLPSESASIASLGKSFVDIGASGYALPFELISILLLGVLIGGAVIARKEMRTK